MANWLFVPPGGGITRDIGAARLGADAKCALIVYVRHVIPYYVAGKLAEAPMLREHSMYWETTEMVRQLNERGYVVDFYDVQSPAPIEWSRYDLAFVQNGRLAECPPGARVKKVFYCTENYWAFQNLSELSRLQAFYARTGIRVPPERQSPVNFSDEYADLATSFGGPFQRCFYRPGVTWQPLAISVVTEPAYVPRQPPAARASFLWLGGGGALLKGLDLAVEAFMATPEAHLYIAGAIEREARVWHWLKPKLLQHPNLHYLGWVDVASAAFARIANSCIGQVYPSASEGGPGAVAQLLHFGLIPIVTETAAVPAAHLGFEISSQEPTTIITEIQAHLRTLLAMPAAEREQRCRAVHDFARAHHTRAAYSASFAALLDRLPA